MNTVPEYPNPPAGYGAWIDANNGGKPFEWLKLDEEMWCAWGVEADGPYQTWHIHGWGQRFKIALPEGHWYYAKQARLKSMHVPHYGKFIPFMTERDVRELYPHMDTNTLRDLGLIRPQTELERFEEFYGGLDNNQRDIVEAFIAWKDGC